MSTIAFNRFDVGIDLRKGESESDANRLRDLKNAYITTGWQIRKRPGLSKITTLEPGTKGLLASAGKLHTFYSTGYVSHANSLFQAHGVSHPDGGVELEKVDHGFVFAGYLYVSAKYVNGDQLHHYLDGSSPSHVEDENCPHTGSITKAASKVFAIDGDVVRYCATNDARDWTAADDAGFIPTGLQVEGSPDALSLGKHKRKLAVFSLDTVQTWDVDPDPKLMALSEVVENVGTQYPRSLSTVAGDLYFLSDHGFRSIATQTYTLSLADVDVGSPIDKLVTPLLVPGITPRSVYYHGAGQFWCAIGNTVFVYSYSKTAKVAAWSYYEYPWPIDDMAELDGVMYIRSGDDVYKVDESVRTDDGQIYVVEGQLPYLSFKKPGALKHVYGLDAVMQGSAEISVLWDVRDPTAEIELGELTGDTRPGGMIPVGASGTELSLRFRNETDEDWRLDSLMLHYDVLGVI